MCGGQCCSYDGLIDDNEDWKGYTTETGEYQELDTPVDCGVRKEVDFTFEDTKNS